MLMKIAIALAVIVLIFVVIVAMQPSAFTLSRSATMAAPADAIFEQVNDFHKWDEWSPWAKLDPNMTKSFDGPASGPGASYAWSGSGKVGQGRMTIVESRPGELVRIKLEFEKPFQATNIADFTFKSANGQTAVTWSMTGNNGFIAKGFGLFVNMDKLVGADFEKGLAQMKAIAEAAKKPAP